MAHIHGKVSRTFRSHLVKGTLAAAAVLAVLLGQVAGAPAGVEDASAGVIHEEQSCESRPGSDPADSGGEQSAIAMAGACENNCLRLWETLLDECQQVPPSQKPQCISDARDDYEACLANC